MNGKWKERLRLLWRSWGYSLFIALVITTTFRSAIADWNDVPTGSMKPTILEGDRIFVNKLAYDLKVPFTTWHLAEWGDPERGDVVVFYSPRNGVRLVKRVVGLPGETVAMRGGRLFVQGREVDYAPMDMQKVPADLAEHPLLREVIGGEGHPVMFTPDRPALRSFGPVTIAEGRYFVMGDNRDNSADSRYFGTVPRSSIVGRATHVVVSLNPRRHYWPRWDRSFSGLL